MGAQHIDALKRNWFFDSFIGPIAWLVIAISPLWIIALVTWLSINWEDLIEWFKVRVTYPRTGYAAPPSYWQNEPSQRAIPKRQSWLQRGLSALGGFWFWLLVVNVSGFQRVTYSLRILLLLLGCLLVMRAIRFGIYPEEPTPSDAQRPGTALQVVRFLLSVLDSFWVLVFLIKILLLVGHKPAIGRDFTLLLAGCFLFFVARSLAFCIPPKPGRLQAIFLCLCGVGCAFLLWRIFHVGVFVTLLVPGFLAASAGSFKLYRYLRDNPIRSI
jgi:hypothetical protein